MTTMDIQAHVEPDDTPGKTRYSFTLRGADGASRDFIIDVPDSDTPVRDENGDLPDTNTDVWVLNQVVMVGDMPEDGFATYTPVAVQ